LVYISCCQRQCCWPRPCHGVDSLLKFGGGSEHHCSEQQLWGGNHYVMNRVESCTVCWFAGTGNIAGGAETASLHWVRLQHDLLAHTSDQALTCAHAAAANAAAHPRLCHRSCSPAQLAKNRATALSAADCAAFNWHPSCQRCPCSSPNLTCDKRYVLPLLSAQCDAEIA
jgi:hypothetical protein